VDRVVRADRQHDEVGRGVEHHRELGHEHVRHARTAHCEPGHVDRDAGLGGDPSDEGVACVVESGTGERAVADGGDAQRCDPAGGRRAVPAGDVEVVVPRQVGVRGTVRGAVRLHPRPSDHRR